MNTNTATKLRRVHVSDVSQQRTMQFSDVSIDLPVRDFVDKIAAAMQLPSHDSNGRPLDYHALLPREGRHLHHSERVEVLQEDDAIVLQPNVDAGMGLLF
jgi:hypothetical protein